MALEPNPEKCFLWNLIAFETQLSYLFRLPTIWKDYESNKCINKIERMLAKKIIQQVWFSKQLNLP